MSTKIWRYYILSLTADDDDDDDDELFFVVWLTKHFWSEQRKWAPTRSCFHNKDSLPRILRESAKLTLHYWSIWYLRSLVGTHAIKTDNLKIISNVNLINGNNLFFQELVNLVGANQALLDEDRFEVTSVVSFSSRLLQTAELCLPLQKWRPLVFKNLFSSDPLLNNENIFYDFYNKFS